MNRTIRLLGLSLFTVTVLALNPAGAARQTAEFAIEGAFCSGCVDALTEAVEALDGVEHASVDVEHRRVRVTFDDATTSAEAVRAHVHKETPFRLTLREVRAAPAKCC